MPPWPPQHRHNPRFAAVADWLDRFAPGELPSVAALDAELRDHLEPSGLRLVAACKPPRRRPPDSDPLAIYEIRITETGQIPCRPNNLHDVCNALAWAAFPGAKRELTRRIARQQVVRLRLGAARPGTRSREHDRLALLDEGGLIQLRCSDGERGVVVGHAIWQHAAEGNLAVRAAAVRLQASCDDAWAAMTADQVRSAVDLAWTQLVQTPDRLHALMAERAGIAIDETSLWA
jgi:hypothetical protein